MRVFAAGDLSADFQRDDDNGDTVTLCCGAQEHELTIDEFIELADAVTAAHVTAREARFNR